MNKTKNTHSALGKNQRYVFDLLLELSTGQKIVNTKYYGGSVYNGQRCISIGRECWLHYGVPWWIIDVRHVGAIFRQKHGDRLGSNSLRSFNKALHGLLKKGLIAEVPVEYIKQGYYKEPHTLTYSEEPVTAVSRAIRFVALVPNAYGIT